MFSSVPNDASPLPLGDLDLIVPRDPDHAQRQARGVRRRERVPEEQRRGAHREHLLEDARNGEGQARRHLHDAQLDKQHPKREQAAGDGRRRRPQQQPSRVVAVRVCANIS
eukprot:5732056-Prymnesium_polylepis.1